RGHVFDPLHHLLHSATADVPTYVGGGAKQLAQVEKLMGAEMVILDDSAPMSIEDRGPLISGADPVPPVILVCKAAAGPAQHRDVQFSQCGQNVIANPARVRDRRFLTDPQAFVYSSAQ